MDWLSRQFGTSLTLNQILVCGGLFRGVARFQLYRRSAIVMVKIPDKLFQLALRAGFYAEQPFLVRWGAVIVKNLLGLFLSLLGIIMSLPGVPGQGLLTILLGLIMLDIPGKRPLEARIIKRPTILAAINNLRARL